MSRRLSWAVVLVGTAVSLAGAACIATRRLVIGSAEGGWFYHYVDTVDVGTFRLLALSCLLVGAGIAASWPLLRRLSTDGRGGVTHVQEWALILAWCLLAGVVQGLLRSTTPDSLGAIFASDNANSFYSVALTTNSRTILTRFERRRHTWPLHAKSNLPGKLLLVRALTHVSKRPEVLAWLIVGLSNLGAVLLYILVRTLFADRFVAGLSAILYLFTPAKLYFFPLLNTVTPVAVLVCACLMVGWLNTGRIVYPVALGLAVYGLALFEPTALVIGVLFAALIAQTIAQGRLSLRAALLHMGVGLLVFGATHAVMLGWFRFDLFRALSEVARDAAEFNVVSQRPYGVWVRQNIFEFLVGVGLCQVVLFLFALADGAADWRSRGRLSDVPSVVLISLSVIAMVGAADVIGVNRGEVIRLWIFLACLAQIPAAYVCRRVGYPIAFGLVMIDDASFKARSARA